jgi:MtN3 and saliva related transmembrane protein
MTVSKQMNIYIGYAAGLCSASAFAPQVWNVYKKRSTKGISLATLIIFFIGQLLWITHGVFNGDSAQIGAGIITAIFYSFLLFAKFTY